MHIRFIQLFICSLLIVSQLSTIRVPSLHSIFNVHRQLNSKHTRFWIRNLNSEVLQRCSKRKRITRWTANVSTSKNKMRNFSHSHSNQPKSIHHAFSRRICRLNTELKCSKKPTLALDRALPLTSLGIGKSRQEPQNKRCLFLVNQQTWLMIN